MSPGLLDHRPCCHPGDRVLVNCVQLYHICTGFLNETKEPWAVQFWVEKGQAR